MVAGFVLLAVAAVSGVILSVWQDNAVTWARHSLQVSNALSELRLNVVQAEASGRGYLISGEPSFVTPYQRATGRLQDALDEVDRLTVDNPVQQRALPELRDAARAKIADMDVKVALVRAGRRSEALSLFHGGKGSASTLGRVTEVTDRMEGEERRLYAIRSARGRDLTWWSRLTLVISTLLVFVFAGWSVAETRRSIRALSNTNQRLAHEIAERDTAQAQVRQLQKIESIGQLTGGIAHDFNNMLAVVIGSLDLARRRLAGSEAAARATGHITNALEAAQRAAVLTARLLAFSRQQPLEPKVVDANKLVGGMSELLRRTLGETVRVETVLAGGLWRICVDAAQLESAIVNLAVNARDAMPDGGKLTIDTANADLDDRYARLHGEVTPGQYVMISITDTGTGMAPDVVERAFDPFYTTKGVGKGTGLGLSQVFGFVKQSNGHVKIYSEVGQGTTIKIYLPRHVGAETQTGHQQADRGGSAPSGRSDEIILVVEDEAQVRHMTVDALRELGYTVIQAADGSQALEQIVLQPHIDLLFTDIVMPGMTGRELADRAAAAKDGLKVLYTTGYTRNAVVHNGVVDAGLHFLAKPFSLDALARKVRDVLDG